ncbi:MAG: orotidine-5'-phosphate decarboxylase [Gemmatimonadota bacterium]
MPEREADPGAPRGTPEIIVALDVPTEAEARSLVDRLPSDAWLKVGLELFTAAGPSAVERLTSAGRHVFLDLKLHDIPNTVAGAVRAAAGLGVRLLTVHAAGGEAMLAAAASAAESGLRLLGITILTSLDDAGLSSVMGPDASVEEAVGRLAGLARESGLDGVVASVAECRAIKLSCGEGFLVATPGIRAEGGDAHDQRRTSTPSVAKAAGADFLIVGRMVTGAPDPAAALASVRAAVAP